MKVTCCDNTFAGACHKALRALSETRVRGVKTNISFITNILTNETFRKGQCYTKFIDETPELFDISESRKPRQQAAGIHRQYRGQRSPGRRQNV